MEYHLKPRNLLLQTTKGLSRKILSTAMKSSAIIVQDWLATVS